MQMFCIALTVLVGISFVTFFPQFVATLSVYLGHYKWGYRADGEHCYTDATRFVARSNRCWRFGSWSFKNSSVRDFRWESLLGDICPWLS